MMTRKLFQALFFSLVYSKHETFITIDHWENGEPVAMVIIKKDTTEDYIKGLFLQQNLYTDLDQIKGSKEYSFINGGG